MSRGENAASDPARSVGRRTARALLPLAVLAAGAGLAWYLLQTPPVAERRPQPPQARAVEVEPVLWVERNAVIEAVGMVLPARRVELRPEVAGTIVELGAELEPGGRIAEGDLVAALDPRPYDLVVAQRRAELAESEAELRLELGHQIVAEREFALLGEEIGDVERALVLREPQLRTARARVARAQAALDAAELDRERTRLRAPFDAIVEQRFVERGARVDAATAVAALVARDEYWVEVGVPAADLRWIRMPGPGEPGSRVRVDAEAVSAASEAWEGRVVRLHAGLESDGRLARLVVAIADPVDRANGAAPLLLGSVVRVEIEGVPVGGFAVDRRHLRDGDSVWIMAEGDVLEIRRVAVGFRGRTEVLVVAGLEAGDRLVTSDLATPVEGMPLRQAGVRVDG